MFSESRIRLRFDPSQRSTHRCIWLEFPLRVRGSVFVACDIMPGGNENGAPGVSRD